MTRTDDLLDRLPVPQGSKIVNVGFGNIAELLVLSKIVGNQGLVFGIERSERILDQTKISLDEPNVRILAGSAEQIPLPPDSMDIVLFKGILHEVRDVNNVLLEAKRVCKNDGRILIVDFSSFPILWIRRSNVSWRLRHPWRLLGSPPDRHPGFGRSEIHSFLNEAGLKEERFEENFARGRFYQHSVPLFLATSIVRK